MPRGRCFYWDYSTDETFLHQIRTSSRGVALLHGTSTLLEKQIAEVNATATDGTMLIRDTNTLSY